MYKNSQTFFYFYFSQGYVFSRKFVKLNFFFFFFCDYNCLVVEYSGKYYEFEMKNVATNLHRFVLSLVKHNCEYFFENANIMVRF